MKFYDLANSKTFFEISQHVMHENRSEYVKTFFYMIAALPFALLYKLWITLIKGAGLAFSGGFLILTLGLSQGLRELFVRRLTDFAANLADWLFFPFALVVCTIRFLLAMLVHPSLFIRY